jgi:glutathione S-transferase
MCGLTLVRADLRHDALPVQGAGGYPELERWLEAVASRPATERAYAIAKEMNPQAPQPVRRAER